MDFNPTEEQRLLKESADRFIEKQYDFDARRKLVDSDEGWSRDNWAQFADLGWLGITVPEEHGGLGWTLADLAVLMEAFGRGLVVEPYLATVLLGAGLVQEAGSDAQKGEILPKVAEGTMHLAFATVEPQGRFDLAHIATSAEKDGGAYSLTGHKAVAFHAQTADRIVVSARTAGGARDRKGITLFLVDPAADGVELRPYRTNDGLRAAEVSLSGVAVDAGDVLGEVDGALPAIEAIVDRTMIAVSAEAAGCMEYLVEATQAFLKERKQFGVPIGKFQVLQHRLVDMFEGQQFTQATAYRAALSAKDADPAVRAKAAATAKIQAGQAGIACAKGAVQLHGGMGMTDELPIGHYYKRLAMIDVLFGNADWHLKRFAEMG